MRWVSYVMFGSIGLLSAAMVIGSLVDSWREQEYVRQYNKDIYRERIRRSYWNVDSARNHYGEIPCADPDCNCANVPAMTL